MWDMAREIREDDLGFLWTAQLEDAGLAKTPKGTVGMLRLYRRLMIFNEDALGARRRSGPGRHQGVRTELAGKLRGPVLRAHSQVACPPPPSRRVTRALSG